MSDLIDKLNVLLRANLANFLGGAANRGTEPPARLTPDRLGKNVDREIAALRKQIDAAIKEEEGLQTRLEDARRQVESLDQQADVALQRGDEASARQFVQRMQQQRRRVQTQEKELERHRAATFDLIQHVNQLEAMVSDARRAQGEQGALPDDAEGDRVERAESVSASEANETSRSPVNMLSDVLRSVRERVEDVIAPLTQGQQSLDANSATPPVSGSPAPGTLPPSQSIPVQRSGQPSGSTPVPDARAQEHAHPAGATTGMPTQSDKDVEDDLAQRRMRLSKPD